ncbi:contactin-associated protein-like 2 [Liolophura sinensis]|uniref:contactin-associated protein-like 2 n=1 Tax=Liolophura sinensis TaxID=3198878 RepID=UPI0031584E97
MDRGVYRVFLAISVWQIIRPCVVLRSPWLATPFESYEEGLATIGNNTSARERLTLRACAQWCLDMNYCTVENSAPLGMQSNAIPDSAISVSDDHINNKLNKNHGRLMAEGGWSSPFQEGLTSHHYWITLTLRRTAVIRQIATQGCSHCVSRWVRKFSLRYSSDNLSWRNYTHNGETWIFEGNVNKNAVVYNDIDPPIVTRYLMLFTENITEVEIKGILTPVLGLRMEIYGCWD